MEKKEKKEGHSTGAMVAAAGAGVVGGAVLGAVVGECPNSSFFFVFLCSFFERS